MNSEHTGYNPLGFHGTHSRFAQICDDADLNFLVLKSAFMESFNSAIPAWISIRTWENVRWDVRVEGNPAEVKLTTGWSTFRNAYLITKGDLLVFAYDKKSSFTVTIFDNDGREKGPTAISNPGCRLTKNTPAASSDMNVLTRPYSPMPSLAVGPVLCQDNGTRQLEINKPNIALFAEFQVSHFQSHQFKLPVEFANLFLQLGVNKVDLKVKSSWVWPVTCQLWEGSATITTGWKAFATDNKIAVGDACRIQPQLEDAWTWLVTIYRQDK